MCPRKTKYQLLNDWSVDVARALRAFWQSLISQIFILLMHTFRPGLCTDFGKGSASTTKRS